MARAPSALFTCLTVVLTCCCSSNRDGYIQIRGSDSEVNLVQRMAERFMETSDASVAIAGGGSGTGIAALLGGSIDVATSSRELEPIEKLLFIRKGIEPVAVIFATDALTVIVHPDNPVAELSVPQIGGLFGGSLKSWVTVGGADVEVVPYGRQSSSGTYVFFRDAVLGEHPYTPSLRQMNGNAQIVEGVSRDPGGIGYVAVGYLRSGNAPVRALRVVPEGLTEGVDPMDETAVRAGRYPIARPLYQFTRDAPTGATLEFLRFELSPDAEQTILDMGFYPVVDSWRSRNAHLYAP